MLARGTEFICLLNGADSNIGIDWGLIGICGSPSPRAARRAAALRAFVAQGCRLLHSVSQRLQAAPSVSEQRTQALTLTARAEWQGHADPFLIGLVQRCGDA